jgi:hypothetical protein
MKSFKAFCIGTIATIGLATGASAQAVKFSPDGARTLSNVGNITVSKGITLVCTGLTGSASVTGGVGSVSALALSGGLFGQCANITFTGYPYTLTPNSTTSVTIGGVVVQGITGNCAGSITGTYNNATSRITFSGATLPATSGGSTPCTISGTIQVSPAATIVPA